MAFFSKNQQEPVPEVETKVWSCSNKECSGWMRDGLTFDTTPECPLCKSPMESEIRILPELQ
ncbi:cold-shock protein [Pseudalkalibacillus decolorationis]|uniref:cold-shock protein n=1 Tax=Pseudalkalibacillus decolorationis TaxID=163879 RepID=UPI0021486F9B|nr:cold-shock protein [Pseudalkalibacillus decolorationis]